MSNSISYKSTIYACYLGHFVQAAVINATPILFLTLMNRYSLTFEQMGRLVLVNFVTQVAVDLFASRYADRYGLRMFAVAAQVFAFAGLILFGLSPFLFANAYGGFIAATVVFSCGGGLLELLLSPIVNAIPTDEKAGAMSMLHAFYAWGQLTVVLVTSLLLRILGADRWHLIMIFWSLLPLVNTFVFLKVPLAPMVAEEHRIKTSVIFKSKYFIICLAAIMAGGAAEISMAQWASSLLEAAMGIPKIIGDYAGVGMFALALGIGRTWYGKMGVRIDIYKAITRGAALCMACFLTVVFSPSPALSLAACALSGLGVSLLWPGTIVIATNKFPLAGTSMFAFLASAGDIGASLGPWLVGLTADKTPALLKAAQLPVSGNPGLRAGFLLAVLFPAAILFFSRYLTKNKSDSGRLSG
jgi:MFS family permease